ncbi:MAG: AAA family ATPase, partial [Betaproteobacteria bacterium]
MALLGPRQVGKTTLARTLAQELGPALFLDLEAKADRETLRRPDLFLPAYRDRPGSTLTTRKSLIRNESR